MRQEEKCFTVYRIFSKYSPFTPFIVDLFIFGYRCGAPYIVINFQAFQYDFDIFSSVVTFCRNRIRCHCCYCCDRRRCCWCWQWKVANYLAAVFGLVWREWITEEHNDICSMVRVNGHVSNVQRRVLGLPRLPLLAPRTDDNWQPWQTDCVIWNSSDRWTFTLTTEQVSLSIAVRTGPKPAALRIASKKRWFILSTVLDWFILIISPLKLDLAPSLPTVSLWGIV